MGSRRVNASGRCNLSAQALTSSAERTLWTSPVFYDLDLDEAVHLLVHKVGSLVEDEGCSTGLGIRRLVDVEVTANGRLSVADRSTLSVEEKEAI